MPAGTPATVLAIVIALLAFPPLINWIPGGYQVSGYDAIVSGWLSGSALVVGIGVVFAILSRRIAPLWREGACDGVVASWRRRPLWWHAIIVGVAFALYCAVALWVFSGRPLLIDEIVQVLQAQILASGHLSRPTFAYPAFFSSMHVIDMHGRYFSQFPIGGPAMLTLGVLVHAPWIVGPVFGVIAIAAYAAYVRVAEPRPGVALGAVLLFAFAPFVVFMSGSHMNHVPTLAWTMIAIAAMARVMTAEAPRPWLALSSGLGFGIAATIRPADALAFALPAGVWYLARALREPRRWRDALPAALGVAIPVLVLLWVNAQTTGAPFLFGYEQLWGKSHAIGFHKGPWGMTHTPVLGLEVTNNYFIELQTYLFETPIPSLLPLIGALALARRFDRFDRYLLASSGLLVGLYFAYWFDGFYLGPRFMYPLVPVLALWTARFLPLLEERFGTGLLYRSSVYGAVAAGVLALLLHVPLRTLGYRNSMVTLRWDADSAAAADHVQNALVLVRESWGSQLVARMWALGVPRSETERIYLRADACALEQAISRMEEDGVHGDAATERLLPLIRDSSRVRPSPYSPDGSERFIPGTRYTPLCAARINDDRAAFTVFTPLLLFHGGGNIYARDLHARDSLLVRAYPDRPIYLLRPPDRQVGVMPRFYRAPTDSLWAAWRAESRASSARVAAASGAAHESTVHASVAHHGDPPSRTGP